jgi:long-chain acyl-CoA synthetase
MTFAILPEHRADRSPSGPAVLDEAYSLDNEGLRVWVRAVAEHLAELGIGRGDVVAAKLTNRVEFVVLMFATWRVGAALTPINPALTDVETRYQLRDSQATLIVVEALTGDQPDGVLEVAVTDLRTIPVGIPEEAVDDPDALALLIYTSGTTGAPKGVMLDHANLTGMTRMGDAALGLSPEDRCLLILPLFHVNGIVVSILLTLNAGGSVVIAPRFNPTTFFPLVEEHRPTFFSAVPTILQMLTDLPTSVQPATGSVRFAICGAAPAPAELLGDFEKRYAIPVLEAYGLSEGTCGSTINPLDGERRAGTVGRAFPGQEVRIVGEDGLPVPAAYDGEVEVRGANVMRGYLGRPDATAEVFHDGWLRTGDRGRLDDDGYLTLVGRSKDMIIRGGENIYPKEIEDVLERHASVGASAVIGIPDPVWGEIVVAYVQPASGCHVDPVALQEHCRGLLTRFKRPARIHVVDHLPLNAVGKIAKPVLRQLASVANSEGGG